MKSPSWSFVLIWCSTVTLTAAQCGPDKSRPYPPNKNVCPPGPSNGTGNRPPPGGGGNRGGGSNGGNSGGGIGGDNRGGGNGGGGRGGITCSASSNLAAISTNVADSSGAKAAALRGNVGCIDMDTLKKRPTAFQGQDATNVYGPMEAGFTKDRPPSMSCLGPNIVEGGIDTLVAEFMVAKFCNKNPTDSDFRTWASKAGGLDECGGHAKPYHYHQLYLDNEPEKCDTYSTTASGHSTRIGTAGDGKGIYGPFIDGGCEPSDLDVCGGRWGVTPDSDGKRVYYYVVQRFAPFTLGCYGPMKATSIDDQLAECRALYSTCDGVAKDVTTAFGTGQYDLDCPCFHPKTHANMKQTSTDQFSFPAYLHSEEASKTCVDTAGGVSVKLFSFAVLMVSLMAVVC